MSRKRHIAVIAGLLCLSAAVQLVTVRRATVTGLDAVRFVDIARQIDRLGLWETVRAEREQPLFPVLVWIFHEGLDRANFAGLSTWPLSAQLAAATAVVFSVVPVYLLALRLVGATAAGIGSIFFCVLPEVARLGADGISDGPHLFLLAWALWASIVYLSGPDEPAAAHAEPTTNHPLWLFPAGVATALALLTRVEAVVLPCALVATLVLVQCLAHTRQPWPRVAAASGSFALGFGLIFGPYLAAVDSLAPQAAMARMLGRFEPPQPAEPATSTALAWQLDDGEPMSFAHKEPTISLRRRGPAAAMLLFAEESAAAFGYWIGLMALWGLCRLPWRSMRSVDLFARSFFVIFSLAAFRFAAAEGYLSARHLLPLVVVGIGCAGHGALEAGRGRWANFLRLPTPRVASATCSRAASAIVAISALSALAYGFRPLHASRLGHRLAAQWLVEKAEASGSVLDTRGWAGMYSGRETHRFEDARRAIAGGRLAYVVLENRELDYGSGRSRTLQRLLEVAAEPAASFPPTGTENRKAQTVLVYRWSQQRFNRWLKSGKVPPPTSLGLVKEP
jgi:4-amino-4-deoxy-L-arabinose transferase-like glycosyltransferase